MIARVSWFTAFMAAMVAGCGGAGAGPSASGQGEAPSAPSTDSVADASSGGGEQSSGESAPDFTLPTLDGDDVSLSDYEGQVVLIDFWSTICKPCLVEMPHLVEIYKKHKDKGFMVLAVSLDGPESRAQVSSVVHDKGMVFPILLDEETTVVGKFNPKNEMPYAVLVNKRGEIVHSRGGYKAGDEVELEEHIEKLLAE